MAYTTEQICNLALAKIGDEAAQIRSLTDGSTEAELCTLFYEPTLRELLAEHTWNFAVKLRQLTASTTDPTFGWNYSYPLPADCIRPLEFRSDSSEYGDRIINEWKIVGRNIYTNTGNAYLMYISYETDPNQMTPLFIRALYTKLASKLAYPMTEDKNLVVSLENELNQVIMPEARRVNGFEGHSFPMVDSEWIEASYTSRSLYDDFRSFSQENYGSLS